MMTWVEYDTRRRLHSHIEKYCVVELDMDAQTDADALKLREKYDAEESRVGFIKRGSSGYCTYKIGLLTLVLYLYCQDF